MKGEYYGEKSTKSNRINSTFIFNRIVISEFHYFRILLFYIYRSSIKGHMPLYMKIYLIGSLLLWLLLYLQEREYILKIIIEKL